jgi:hypothetical protein
MNLSLELEMDDLHLFGGVVRAPEFLPADVIAECRTYREAVRMAWAHRRIKAMTQRSLAERTECYPSHVSDYLHPDDKPARRSLPADKVSAFCGAVGNWGVQQWLNKQSRLTIMEEVIAIAQRAA